MKSFVLSGELKIARWRLLCLLDESVKDDHPVLRIYVKENSSDSRTGSLPEPVRKKIASIRLSPALLVASPIALGCSVPDKVQQIRSPYGAAGP